MSACPRGSEHVWLHDQTTSDFSNMRYDCANGCGARARRKRPVKVGQEVHPGSEIVEVKPGSRWDKPHRGTVKESSRTVGEKAGNNKSGHYLPPSGGRKRGT